MARKTVKDLSKDFEQMMENVEMLRRDFEEKTNVLKKEHEEKIKELEGRVAFLEQSNGFSKKEESSIKMISCRECSYSVEKKADLKVHILSVHPKQYDCNNCGKIFDSRLEFELHQKVHTAIKPFNCELCDHTFYTKWRLDKHVRQHGMTSFRYCHFFNNNKFCKYEELGCMFRHNEAPVCPKNTVCRSKLCQFKHITVSENFITNMTSLELGNIELLRIYTCNKCDFKAKTEAVLNNHAASSHEMPDEKNNDEDDNFVEQKDVECVECTFNCCISIVHTFDITRKCPECDFQTKCEDAWDKHWASKTEHNRANWTPFE